jgi:hypothetical protein
MSTNKVVVDEKSGGDEPEDVAARTALRLVLVI